MKPTTKPTTRFELKYRIEEDKAAAITRWIEHFMEPDAFGEGGGASYPVHSLYLDSEDWSIFRDTRSGLYRRFKLRARTYSFSPDAAVFLEVKQRQGETMWKSRVEVPRAEAIRLMRGEPARNVKSTPGLEEFLAQLDRRSAYPRVWVTYRRDAWLGRDRAQMVRVTFDRRIQCAPPTPDMSEPPRWYDVPISKGIVILELKYAGSYPGWVAEMIRTFDLTRKSMSKYKHSVNLLLSGTAAGIFPDERPPEREQVLGQDEPGGQR